MSTQVTIDTEECIGCHSCVDICPEVFDFDDADDKAVVINPDGGDIKCAEEAAEACPAEYINIE